MSKPVQSLFSYSGKWIATSSDRKKVFASGSTIEELDNELEKNKLKEKDYETIIISKVPPVNVTVTP